MRVQLNLSENLKKIMSALSAEDHTVHVVGGAVRNTILGYPVKDYDLATSASPTAVAVICGDVGMEVVPTGIDHGTVTVVCGGEAFEVTTWRRDVATDGRRAVVAFAETIEEDAQRRDFTMNALYADIEGNVTDPTGQGVLDIEARRLRFIGDADARIREDYLRIMRYFRFMSQFGFVFEDDADFRACQTHMSSLATVSKERLGAELLGILKGQSWARSLSRFQETCGLHHIMPRSHQYLVEGSFEKPMKALHWAFAQMGVAPQPAAILAVITDRSPKDELRLSKALADDVETVRDYKYSHMDAMSLGHFLGFEKACSVLAARRAEIGAPSPHDKSCAPEAARAAYGAMQVFPVRPADLMPEFTGPALGAELRRQRKAWAAAGCCLPEDEPQDVVFGARVLGNLHSRVSVQFENFGPVSIASGCLNEFAPSFVTAQRADVEAAHTLQMEEYAALRAAPSVSFTSGDF